MAWMASFKRLWRHLWLDADDVHRVLPPQALARLQARVADRERLHGGEIRVCVEASLPRSYLWRHWRGGLSVRQVVRERAVMMFGKLRVWDTARNNGVLVYLLLAERAIEIVADRGLGHVTPAQWQALAAQMGAAFRAGRYEEGLAAAVDAVAGHLARTSESPATGELPRNELPDIPVIIPR